MTTRLLLVFLAIVIVGCATSYTTPGGTVRLSALADADINELMTIEPAAQFPARIAIARVQAPGYQSYRLASYGTGRYSVVTTREVESDKDLDALASMDNVAGLAPINRILLPTRLDSIKALREAAARLKADVLLMYTFDTSFHVGEQKLLPLNTVTLGFLKNQDVFVTTTASAAFFDVRTEFLYGLSEATAKEEGKSSVWNTQDVVDDLRVATERAAFEGLMPEIVSTWANIVAEHTSPVDMTGQ